MNGQKASSKAQRIAKSILPVESQCDRRLHDIFTNLGKSRAGPEQENIVVLNSSCSTETMHNVCLGGYLEATY